MQKGYFSQKKNTIVNNRSSLQKSRSVFKRLKKYVARNSINDVKAKVQPPHIMQRHSFFTRNITRKISLLITWLVVNIFPKANADIITFAWGILLLGVIYLFSKGDPQNTLYGALLLELWYILDCVDGEVARFNNKDSLKGIFLDLFLHTSIQPLLFLSLAIGTYKIYHNNLYFSRCFSNYILHRVYGSKRWTVPRSCFYTN